MWSPIRKRVSGEASAVPARINRALQAKKSLSALPVSTRPEESKAS